ncbi:MAG: Na/Pi cotransporter family protein [Nitrospirae bacterium]|nr:Na/Pi cotransporter family protein [Nitrospirota bacterium]MBI5696897.1 Na/Pi cotransporter family protein [Nitrospirota bacterium]
MTNLMYISLFGGVMLLVYGIRQAGEGLRNAAGSHLKEFLTSLTRNRVSALLLGTVITVLTQSSTATTVMLVGFVNSGLMSFAQTLGVILGADVGTTVTVQIIAFDILEYSVLFVGVGLLGMYAGKTRIWKDAGQGVLGFGFIFLAMKIMADSMAPLKDSEAFGLMMRLLADNPFMGLLLAAAFTAVVHSSAATIGVALSLASQGLIDLPQAIPIIFGANIGTCATAVVVGVTGSTDARRVAYAHTLFKLLGVALFFPFMGHLADIVSATTSDPMRQIANAHTFFNVSLALVFLPFTGVVSRFLATAVSDRFKVEPFGPKYLDEGVLSTPSLALSQAARETIRMADIVQDMLGRVMGALKTSDEREVEEVEEMDDKVDRLDRGIRFYLAKLSRSALTDEQSRREMATIAVTSDLENIGDIIDKHVMYLARKRIKNNVSFSKVGISELTEFHRKVMDNLALAVAAFTTNDYELAQRVMHNRERISEMEKEFRNAHIERLRKGLPESFETSAIHLDLLSNLERVNSYVTHIALSILEVRGEGGGD